MPPNQQQQQRLMPSLTSSHSKQNKFRRALCYDEIASNMENTWAITLATKRAFAAAVMMLCKNRTAYRGGTDTGRSSGGAMPDNADRRFKSSRRAETITADTVRHPPWKTKTSHGFCQDPNFNENIKMLALSGPWVMDRLSHEMAARRDRQVRLHSVQTDLELDLPPNIALPDGEEVPYGSSTRLQIRDNEQESEIYQKCIRPPPNRTVFDGESPPPYRSSSAGVLGSGDSGDWSSGGSSGGLRVVRCHSVSSGSASGSTTSTVTAQTPSVIVPTRSRRLSAFSDSSGGGGALASLTMVPCRVEPRRPTKPSPPQRGAV